MALPKYYRNKIFTDEEREKLWISMIDKKERWVNGVKINIKNGLDDYYNVLEIARAKNKRLGYGDDEIDWERRHYERAQRNLNFMERLKNVK